ncbi:hypothetical protein NPIL_694321 [Nephila pilipes]|uniref:Uncharacterized protein n=1 Tax=Nephila pilipes TaxID=299642 RepID=A0A8X6UNE7_NEPPI|nr:hypothetical protein NPIL_694321 [Nephila pilipes]
MAGALNQKTTTRLEPLAFFSQKLNDTQMKYVNVNGKSSTNPTDIVKPTFVPNANSDITPSTTKLVLDIPRKTILRQTHLDHHVRFPHYFVSSR